MSTIADKTIIDNDAGEAIGVAFEFTNGNMHEFEIAELPEAMITRLAIHGWAQKGGDSYAGAAQKGMSVDECEAGVLALWAALKSGQFGTSRTAGGKLLEAFIRWAVDTGRTADEAKTAFADLTDDQKKELRKAAPIKAKLADIEAERAAAAAKVAEGDETDLESLFD